MHEKWSRGRCSWNGSVSPRSLFNALRVSDKLASTKMTPNIFYRCSQRAIISHGVSSASKLFHFEHIQPVYNHHSLNKIPFQIDMPRSIIKGQRAHSENGKGAILHPIKLVTLNSDIPRSQMLQPSFLHLDPHRLLENHQGFVPLAHDPLVGFLPPTRIWRQEEPWPKSRFSLSLAMAGRRRGGRGRGQPR